MKKTRVHWMLLAVIAVAPTAVLAQQAAQVQAEKPPAKTEAKKEEIKKEETQKPTEEPKKEEDSNLTSPGGRALGMSILGNQEAPKALVIVPWKSSELGNGPSVSTLLDDSRLPIDKEVFLRMLSYYEISSEKVRPNGAPTNAKAAQPNTAAQRRKP
jgi:hypothetical protein